jgi:hypothetical protein
MAARYKRRPTVKLRCAAGANATTHAVTHDSAKQMACCPASRRHLQRLVRQPFGSRLYLGFGTLYVDECVLSQDAGCRVRSSTTHGQQISTQKSNTLYFRSFRISVMSHSSISKLSRDVCSLPTLLLISKSRLPNKFIISLLWYWISMR